MSTIMRILAPHLSFVLLASSLALGCGDKDASGSSSASAEAKAPAGPCDGAGDVLSGIAILEVKDSPDDAAKGAAFVTQLKNEIAETCVAKGYDKSQAETLACYEKNKGKRGYFVLKGCDDKIGKELVAAVVEKHGGKKSE